jgi:hypothetical protein
LRVVQRPAVTGCPLEACRLVADALWMRGLRFRGFGVFAEALTAAGLLLMALSGVAWATVDSTRGATSPAETMLRGAVATIMGAAHGDER